MMDATRTSKFMEHFFPSFFGEARAICTEAAAGDQERLRFCNLNVRDRPSKNVPLYPYFFPAEANLENREMYAESGETMARCSGIKQPKTGRGLFPACFALNNCRTMR